MRPCIEPSVAATELLDMQLTLMQVLYIEVAAVDIDGHLGCTQGVQHLVIEYCFLSRADTAHKPPLERRRTSNKFLLAVEF